MDDLAPLWMVFPGLIAGFVCTPLLTHWIRLLVVALGKDPMSPPVPGQRLGAIVVAVLHPAPWLILAGLPVLVFRLITDTPSESWLWFIAGAIIGPICLFTMGFYLAAKNSRNAAKEA